MLTEMDVSIIPNIDVDKIKEKMCSQIKTENIELVLFTDIEYIDEHDPIVKKHDESKICLQEKFPISIELDRNYCFDEEKLQERLLKMIQFSSEFITEDINTFIKKNNCKMMVFRNLHLSHGRNYCNGHYDVNIEARIIFILDK